MPKRKEPGLTPEEQHKRFVEAAKKAGVTQDEKEFEDAVRRAVPAPKNQQKRPTEKSKA